MINFVDIHTGKESPPIRIVEIRCIRCKDITFKELKPNDFDDYNYAMTVCSRCIVINYNLDRILRN